MLDSLFSTPVAAMLSAFISVEIEYLLEKNKIFSNSFVKKHREVIWRFVVVVVVVVGADIVIFAVVSISIEFIKYLTQVFD